MSDVSLRPLELNISLATKSLGLEDVLFPLAELNHTRIFLIGFQEHGSLKGILRNIGLRPIYYNENLFRTIKLTRVSNITFVIRDIFIKYFFNAKNHIWP